MIGTDDTGVKVLDIKLPFARTGRIWPYYGDAGHPVILYDYTATRERAGPEKFLTGYRGVRRQLFLWVGDNYFSLSTTITFGLGGAERRPLTRRAKPARACVFLLQR